MRVPEIVTVSDARSGLSRILAELAEAGPQAEPVLIGAHRKAQGVLLSIEAYERLTERAARREAAESVTGSLAAEGLRPTSASDEDVQAYVRGTLSTEELVARALARHSPESRQAAG
ncbi:type II toxin-antitoxin system Phd/YefM family antitoxin [Streptomyces tailanensis]|uniref:antitoxin VbhA family protein n=1 Tax=Streptomyces tailanensis TaxID=2569858 RepID=UPI00122DE888|nr:type II toxin-antitoxin system Phd/YefM family antitoxin [Streptomyces tailanensis]